MFWAAGRYTVFDDEALSCRLYVLPPGDLLAELWRGADPDPPLYYLLQSGWVRVFGVGPLGLRSLSILCFLAGLMVMRAAGTAWFDRATGLATLAICALHPAHLFFGFAGRWYAMMFLMVALLLWATAACRGLRADPVHSTGLRFNDWRGVVSVASVAWVLAAAGACYVNYFGPVMAGLLWLAGLWRERSDSTARVRWILRGVIAAVLFAPWIVPFWHRLVEFPASAGGGASHLGTLVRLAMTLAAGNLAGPTAWWVWAPMAVFSALMVVLLLRQRDSIRVRRPAGAPAATGDSAGAPAVTGDAAGVWPLALVVIGSIAAGVASRTLVDKYVLVLSGPACLLAAALLVRAWREPRVPWERRAGMAATCALALAWTGCGVNMVTQRHWSSLRWLDPFPRVAEAVYDECREFSGVLFVASHPSFRYYFALEQTRRWTDQMVLGGEKPVWRSFVADSQYWRRRFYEQASAEDFNWVLTPGSFMSAVNRGPVNLEGADEWRFEPEDVVTIETTGFEALPDWDAFRSYLSQDFTRVGEPELFLEDPDTALKDRIDPGVRHPRWRIELQRWRLKE